MPFDVYPRASSAGKTRYALTLLSGTSWTVPAGVTYVNVTLFGGGGGGGASTLNLVSGWGRPGQVVQSTVTTTPGASINYSIGAGGTSGGSNVDVAGGNGGTTTFTGATSAAGGQGGADTSSVQATGTQAGAQYNGGQGTSRFTATAGVGGAGKIDIEYWL